jgi:hypothetical protein
MPSLRKRIEYLESKLPEKVGMVVNENGTKVMKKVSVDEKYRDNFEKYATYMGNGVYQWKGAVANDTRVLYLIAVLRSEGIVFKEDG